MSRYPVFLGIRLSEDLAARLKRAAREDDRPLSAYIRRMLSKALIERSDARQ